MINKKVHLSWISTVVKPEVDWHSVSEVFLTGHMQAFLLSALLSLSLNVFAFESFPEFESISENDPLDFERPKGAEYQSDLITYMKPEEWEYEWLKRDLAADVSFGSISPEHFALDNRLKARTHILDDLEFRFTHFMEEHFERSSLHNILEFIYWPQSKFGIGAYGEPSYRKARDDTGLALFYKPLPNHEIKLFHTWVDATRIRRNDQTDTFEKNSLPYSRGIAGRAYNEPGEFFIYAFRHESRTVWNFNDRKLQFTYAKWFASFYARKRMFDREDFFFTFRTQYDSKLESRAPFGTGSQITTEAWTNTRNITLFRTHFLGLGPSSNWELKPGLVIAHRRFLTTSGDVYYYDTIPHVWWRIPSFTGEKSNGYLDLGADSTYHHWKGSSGINTPGDRDHSFEWRFNLAYGIKFSQKAELRLMATADLDEFGSSETFQGGNARFRVSF